LFFSPNPFPGPNPTPGPGPQKREIGIYEADPFATHARSVGSAEISPASTLNVLRQQLLDEVEIALPAFQFVRLKHDAPMDQYELVPEETELFTRIDSVVINGNARIQAMVTPLPFPSLPFLSFPFLSFPFLSFPFLSFPFFLLLLYLFQIVGNWNQIGV
jgi:hypothetical protein